MNILEAARTGLPMKRPYMKKFIHDHVNGVMVFPLHQFSLTPQVKAFCRKDFLADDWEVQQPVQSKKTERFCRSCGGDLCSK